MKRILKTRLTCISLCAALLVGASACSPRKKTAEDVPSAPESSTVENSVPDEVVIPDFETVTAGIDLTVPRELAITRPLEDIEIDSEVYYITGNSDPGSDLLLNGEKVEDRGTLGSFGYFAELREGVNTFAFEQGDVSKTVTITRQADNEIYTTDKITKPYPDADDVIGAGEAYTLRCTAPSGASVTARVLDQTITLEQRAATAVEGVPAVFVAEFVPSGASVTENIGSVTYTLEWMGKESEYVSAGSLFVVGSGSPLLVRAKDVSATVFTEESDESDYVSTLKRGAVDIVTEMGTDMYRLAMGGWVVKSSLEPLTETTETENKVSGVNFSPGNKMETLRLTGSAAVPYKAERRDGQLVLTFYRTSGVEKADLTGSRLLADMQVSRDGDNTVIEFKLNEANPLWGYLVEYEEDGILITFRAAPELAAGARPLQGIIVVLDPGHGGTDPGALGISRESGAAEKDVTRATAQAARIYLEALGATVLMTREGDDSVDMNKRLEMIQQPEVDFAVSMHCNSIPYNSDGTRPSGTEIYYYEDGALFLAKTVQEIICERTGRNDRGAKYANYKITLNSNAPSIMIEMGFMTNPREYDNLCDKQSIYDTAAAIADGIIAVLEPANS